jgi:hypothetical protein
MLSINIAQRQYPDCVRANVDDDEGDETSLPIALS